MNGIITIIEIISRSERTSVKGRIQADQCEAFFAPQNESASAALVERIPMDSQAGGETPPLPEAISEAPNGRLEDREMPEDKEKPDVSPIDLINQTHYYIKNPTPGGAGFFCGLIGRWRGCVAFGSGGVPPPPSRSEAASARMIPMDSRGGGETPPLPGRLHSSLLREALHPSLLAALPPIFLI